MIIVDVLAGAVRGGTSIMYAGLGETISERAGVINLGTEGAMLLGALGGYAVAVETGNPWLGVLAGALGGAPARAWCTPSSSSAAGPTSSPAGLTPATSSPSALTALFGAAYVGQQINALRPRPRARA